MIASLSPNSHKPCFFCIQRMVLIQLLRVMRFCVTREIEWQELQFALTNSQPVSMTRLPLAGGAEFSTGGGSLATGGCSACLQPARDSNRTRKNRLDRIDRNTVGGIVQVALGVPTGYDHWLGHTVVISGACPDFVIAFFRKRHFG